MKHRAHCKQKQHLRKSKNSIITRKFLNKHKGLKRYWKIKLRFIR